MKKELSYFKIDNGYGGNQSWFTDFMMKMGGCAAVAACDSCIYLDLYQGTDNLYPFSKAMLNREDYIRFSKIMKPYLRPRLTGINRLQTYIDGFEKYLSRADPKRRIAIEGFDGHRETKEARQIVIEQIEKGYLVPCLLLRHRFRSMKNYVWHWFLLTGYECRKDVFLVKAVTYGGWRWLDFDVLWDTGYRKRGGLIIYHIDK